ncbi:hypothetical protein ACQPZX_29335 [Actinoplanes sp. CA-142083]|uniref:hypothetical protein n=1 Tax=Actinoplanes sp. CA-142083 TaxID=3239903 RepID=UPI003D8D0911
MTVPNPAQERVYPLDPPDDDRRFTLGLIFTIGQVLANAGYPEVRSGGDLVALQQAIFNFLYAAPGGAR